MISEPVFVDATGPLQLLPICSLAICGIGVHRFAVIALAEADLLFNSPHWPSERGAPMLDRRHEGHVKDVGRPIPVTSSFACRRQDIEF